MREILLKYHKHLISWQYLSHIYKNLLTQLISILTNEIKIQYFGHHASNKYSTLSRLLENFKSIAAHYRTYFFLAMEIFKLMKSTAPIIFSKIVQLKADFHWAKWSACALTFVYSSTNEIFLFEIVKINLTNLRRKKSPQLLDQSKHISLALSTNTFSSDQSKDGCE